MAKYKFIYPTVIEPTPLNGQQYQFDSAGTTSSSSIMNTTSDETTKTRTLSPPQYAKEVVSQRLNTISGQITSKFAFTNFGALEIGEENVTGWIRITGDGIVATDINGQQTFYLDGRTGNATFSGELAASNILTGEINLGTDGRIYGGDGTNYRWVLGKLFEE